MISSIAKLSSRVIKSVATTEAFKYAKGRAVWYYHLALNPEFSKTMTNLYKYNRVERELNRDTFDRTEKRVFHISPEGYVYDARTGAIIGNIDKPTGNQYHNQQESNDAEYETNSYGNFYRKDKNDEQPATA